ncbi:MAG: PRC-barrel domain-containing protein [Fibrobacteria bacterium]
MLNKANSLKGYKMNGRDGEIGSVREFYFDDNHWTIRYLVAETAGWLTGRLVLISPHALGIVDATKRQIEIALTKKQIEESPSLESDKPVSRQFEKDYYSYYGWPTYWAGPYMWGAYPYIPYEPEQWKNDKREEESWDPHLRSTREVGGDHIQAEDGEIGHVVDFIIDDATWAIRYLVVDTRNWWPGKKVLISPQWIKRISWPESKVFVQLTREAVKQSQEYTDESILTREYEAGLHVHYGREGYWAEVPIGHLDESR